MEVCFTSTFVYLQELGIPLKVQFLLDPPHNMAEPESHDQWSHQGNAFLAPYEERNFS